MSRPGVKSAQYSVSAARDFGWSSVTGELHPDRLGHLQKYLSGSSLLDAGCGGGGYVDFLSRQGFRVTGVDAHEQLLQNAREMRRRGEYVQADIGALPFGSKTFDCAYCFDVLEHVDDLAAMKELARVTRTRLIVAVPKKDDVMFQFGLTFGTYRDATHLRYYTELDLEELLRTVPNRGYQIVPELYIPLRALVDWAIGPDARPMPSHADADIATGWLKRLSNRACRAVVRRLLNVTTFCRQIPAGLVGVVDL